MASVGLIVPSLSPAHVHKTARDVEFAALASAVVRLVLLARPAKSKFCAVAGAQTMVCVIKECASVRLGGPAEIAMFLWIQPFGCLIFSLI